MRKTAKFYVVSEVVPVGTFNTQKEALTFIGQVLEKNQDLSTEDFTLIKGHELSFAAKTTISLQVVSDPVESDTEAEQPDTDSEDTTDLSFAVAS